MTETEANPANPPRFPYVAAVLCAACVGMAAWTWMRYSYCWDTTLEDIWECEPAEWQRAYVRFHCRVPETFGPGAATFWLWIDPAIRKGVPVMMPAEEQRNLTLGEECEFVGRLVPEYADQPECALYVDAWASRFYPASIAGLVVGAMGVFVFAVALRHWLGERKAFKTSDTAAPPESRT